MAKKPFQRKKTKLPSLKVSRKVDNKKKKVFVEDPTLRSKWNKKQSVQKNFKRLGIASDPNEAIMRKATSNSNLVQNYERFEKKKKREVTYQCRTERNFAKLMVDTYGNDFEAMARDIKLNPYQLTQGELKRKCRNYLKLFGKKDKEAEEKSVTN